MILRDKINYRLVLIYMLICVSVFQSGVDFQLSMFIYHTPKYQCQIPNDTNTLITNDNCYYYKDVPNPVKRLCGNWTFDKTNIESTFVTDMMLICENRYLQLILVPLRNVGGLFAVFLGLTSDIFGRRKTYTVCCLLDTIVWILIAIVPINYAAHAILRFFKLFGIATAIIGFVLVSELTPQKYRNFFLINYWTFFSIGLAFCPIYVKYIPSWRMAWLISAWPMALNLLVPFLLLESPKWLLANNRKQEAIKILRILDQYTEDKSQDSDLQKDENVNQVKEASCMCGSPVIMSRLGVLLLLTWSFYIVYQGTSTNLEFAISNIYLNAVIMGLIELPAGPLGYLSSKCFGGVTSVVMWTIVGMISFIIIPENWDPVIGTTMVGKIARTILASLAKFFLILAWNVSAIFYVYLFPTNKRNFVANLSEITGFFGGAIGGFVGYYFRKNGENNGVDTISNLIYGAVLTITITLFGLVIPSVQNAQLPNTIEEAEKIQKGLTCLPCDEVEKDNKR